ncbi:MAG: glycine cleavage system protein H [Promethearchaeati archaeon SRVP18_Atabeyarchaeia-1]
MEFLEFTIDKFIFRVVKGNKYSQDDVWLASAGERRWRIGITDFLQKTSGDAVIAQLPDLGRTFQRGSEVAQFETVKTIISVPMPVTGKVVERNDRILDEPGLLNSDPYGKGWIVTVEASNVEKEFKHLLSDSSYFELMKKKVSEVQSKPRK